MTPQLLHSMEDTVGLLGVGRTTVYNLAAQGEFEVVHIGRRALATDESVRAYVERLSNAANDDGTAA